MADTVRNSTGHSNKRFSKVLAHLKEKHKVEEEQRRKRAERAARNEEFQGQYFMRHEDGLWYLRDSVSLQAILETSAEPVQDNSSTTTNS